MRRRALGESGYCGASYHAARSASRELKRTARGQWYLWWSRSLIFALSVVSLVPLARLIALVQEQRFCLVTHACQGFLSTLAHDARVDASALLASILLRERRDCPSAVVRANLTLSYRELLAPARFIGRVIHEGDRRCDSAFPMVS